MNQKNWEIYKKKEKTIKKVLVFKNFNMKTKFKFYFKKLTSTLYLNGIFLIVFDPLSNLFSGDKFINRFINTLLLDFVNINDFIQILLALWIRSLEWLYFIPYILVGGFIGLVSNGVVLILTILFFGFLIFLGRIASHVYRFSFKKNYLLFF